VKPSRPKSFSADGEILCLSFVLGQRIADVAQKETGIFRNEGRSKMGFVTEVKKTCKLDFVTQGQKKM
jgi:hypothetical protein